MITSSLYFLHLDYMFTSKDLCKIAQQQQQQPSLIPLSGVGYLAKIAQMWEKLAGHRC